MRVSDESFANAFTRARAIQAWRHEKGLFIPVPVPVAAPPQSSRDTKARISGIWCVSTLRRSDTVIYRQARLAPSGNRRDRGTKGPCFLIPQLPDRFRRPDLLCRRRRSSNVRALFATSPCLASETTCDQSFRGTASL